MKNYMRLWLGLWQQDLQRIRLWILGKLHALPLSIVNAEIGLWQQDLQKQRSIADGLRVIVASCESSLEKSRQDVEAYKEQLASRVRDLRICLEEKAALDEQLRRRSAAVANTDTRVVKSATIMLLESLPVLVQEAACYSTRKVAQDTTIPGSMGFGKNMKRDEACEWAGHWLREKKEKFRDSDVNLACELYYTLDHKE